MPTLFASRARARRQGHSALRVVWLAALLVFTATYVMANGGGDENGNPIVVDANTTPCITTSAHYATIQAAVNVAPSGATIL